MTLSWAPPPRGRILLPAGEVHVWSARMPLSPDLAAAVGDTLSADERERAARLRSTEERVRFVAVRGLLRTLLGGYLGEAPDALRFRYGGQGKPALEGPRAAELCFNVSHADELALLAFAAAPGVGVDVERVREVAHAERIVGRVFPAAEAGAWRALPPERRLAAFFAGWTRLEALAKLRGDGVWRMVAEGAHDAPSGVSLLELPPLPGYAAALAVEGTGARVRCWRWEG